MHSEVVSTRWMMAALAIGALLRVYNYATRGALWTDEAGLALNVVGRDLSQVGHPFVYEQAAPYLYVVGTKVLTLVVGADEWLLRLPSLLAGIASMVLTAWLARRVVGALAGALTACMLAASPVLIYYAGEFKPYAGDAMCTALLVLLAVDYLATGGGRKLVGLAVLGVVIPGLSLPSVFVLAGIGAALAWDWLERDRRPSALGWLLVTGGVWAVAFLVQYQLVLMAASKSPALSGYQHMSDVNAPFPPTSIADLRWYVGHTLYVFEAPGGLGSRYVAALLWLSGLVIAARRRGIPTLLLFVVPWVAVFGASAAHAYVIDTRLMVFLVPLALVPIGASLQALLRQGAYPRSLAVACLFALLVPPLWQLSPVLTRDRRGPSIAGAAEVLQKHYRPGDRVFVEQQVEWTYLYYHRRLGLPGEPIFGDAGPDDVTSDAPPADQVLQSLQGAGRVWLVLPAVGSQGGSTDQGTASIREANTQVLTQARRQGRVLEMYDGNNAQLWLFAMERPASGEGEESAIRRNVREDPELRSDAHKGGQGRAREVELGSD